MKMLIVLLVSLGFLAGCGSSSKSTVTYDSGVATGTEEVVVDAQTGASTQEVTVKAVDEASQRETTSATILAGTTMLDDQGTPITESVEVAVASKTENFEVPTEVAVADDESTTGTVIDVSALTKSGATVAEIDQEIQVTVAAPELEDNSKQQVKEAWMLIEDPAEASSLRAATRGILIKVEIKADGSIDLSFEYIPGRRIKVIWIFEEIPATTGATGAN